MAAQTISAALLRQGSADPHSDARETGRRRGPSLPTLFAASNGRNPCPLSGATHRAKSLSRSRIRHDSAVIRWIRVAVALVLVLALSTSVYWGYTLFLLATGLIVLGVAYCWPRLTDSPQPRAT